MGAQFCITIQYCVDPHLKARVEISAYRLADSREKNSEREHTKDRGKSFSEFVTRNESLYLPLTLRARASPLKVKALQST